MEQNNREIALTIVAVVLVLATVVGVLTFKSATVSPVANCSQLMSVEFLSPTYVCK